MLSGRPALFAFYPCACLRRGPHLCNLPAFPTVTDHLSAEPSEGVFYVVRLPDGWQLCSFRFDEYGHLGLPDCWVQVLEPFLNIWLEHLVKEGPLKFQARHDALQKELGLLVASYDTFPRGEVRRGRDDKHFVVHHGGELSRSMRVPRRDIEEAFGIHGVAKWVENVEHISDHRNAQRVRSLLQIHDKWEDL